ncbi:MAG: hypothetical protein AAF611_12705 [Bacteroidota bacterium]
MKKKKLKSLSLNKQKVSQLHNQKGGNQSFTTDEITMSTCTCVSCLPTNCQIPSVVICPPPITKFCTIDCQTRDCSFAIVCPIPIDAEI